MRRKSPRLSSSNKRKIVVKTQSDESSTPARAVVKKEENSFDIKLEINNDSIHPDVVTSNNNGISIVIKEEVTSKQTQEIKPNKKRKVKKENGTQRPTPEECEYVTSSLSRLHPEVVDLNDVRRKTLLESCGMRNSITDAIVATMLSQNTTDANSKAAFKGLKAKFPTWENVANCDDITKLEDCIRVAGLAKTRAERIQTMLRTVKEEKGFASLDYIKDIPHDDDVKKELSRFKGLGPKTISCVLLFALGRPEFPVDTHVLRITKSMGWVQSQDTRESAYDHLNKHVQNHLKLDLHCLLVQHGKCCHKCASRGRPQFPPKDGSKLDCPLVKVASWRGIVPEEYQIQTDKQNVKTEEEETGVNFQVSQAEINLQIKEKVRVYNQQIVKLEKATA